MEQIEFQDVTCIHATEKATLLLIGGLKYWVPWKVIDEGSDIKKAGDKGRVYIEEWFVKQDNIY